jgi:uncharacterized protein (DUF111 family)
MWTKPKAPEHRGSYNRQFKKPEVEVERRSRSRCVKLTSKDVLNIRTEYEAAKTTHEALAAQYGVCRSNITAIIQRRSWSDI